MLSGTLTLTVDGEDHLLGPGDSFVVEPGARHLPRNAGIYRATPATASCGSSRRCVQRVASKSSFPSSPRSTTPNATPVPPALDRALFAILAAAGKLLGLRIPRDSRTPTETGNS